MIFQGDIRIDSDIKTAVYETISQFGRIDILFNNAGICAYGLVHELPEEEWDAMIDINLKGAWLTARHIAPVMIEQKSGNIVNNSSIAGLRVINRLSHYAVSNWGLVGQLYPWMTIIFVLGHALVNFSVMYSEPQTALAGLILFLPGLPMYYLLVRFFRT